MLGDKISFYLFIYFLIGEVQPPLGVSPGLTQFGI